MNVVIMSFDPNKKQSNLREKAMKYVRAVESDIVKPLYNGHLWGPTFHPL